MYSGYTSFVRYVIGKHFPPNLWLAFHSLSAFQRRKGFNFDRSHHQFFLFQRKSSRLCFWWQEQFPLTLTQDTPRISNMFCKCYRLFESLIQLLPAMVCKHLLSCFLSSTAHVNTPTHLSITSTNFLCHSETSALPFQASSQRSQKSHFPKYFLSCRGKCWRLEWSVLFLTAKQSRMSL